MADWPVLQKKRWESFCLRHLLKPKCSFHGCGVSRCFALFWLPPNAHRTQASPGAPGGPGSPPPPAALWRRRPRLAGPPAGWRRGPRSNHGPAGANPVPEGGYPWSDAITTKRRGEKPRREMAWHICQGTGWGWAQSKKGVSEYWALRSRLQFVQDPFSQFQCGPCQHQSPVVADIVALWFSAGWSTATGRAGGGAYLQHAVRQVRLQVATDPLLPRMEGPGQRAGVRIGEGAGVEAMPLQQCRLQAHLLGRVSAGHIAGVKIDDHVCQQKNII